MKKEDEERKPYYHPVNSKVLFKEISKLDYKKWQHLKRDIDFMFQKKVDKVTLSFEEFKDECNKIPVSFYDNED